MDNVCGYIKDDGEPCQRPAGWGTDSSLGECRDHAEEYRVPRKLDEATKNNIVGAARTGAKIEHCAAIGGIARSTLWDWLTTGEAHIEDDIDSPLAEFYRTFQRARGAGAVQTLQDCSPEFLASASFGYTKAERREVTGEGGSPLEVVINDSIREVTEQ